MQNINKANLFAYCAMLGASIVSAYRSTLPEGFDPKNEDPVGGNPNPQGAGDFGNGQQQQQQQNGQQQQQQNGQQQEPPAPDPFRDVDLNLLDEGTRNAVLEARNLMNQMHGQVRATSRIQSERDRLLHEHGQLQSRLQSMQTQRPQNQQQQQQQQELSLEDELRAMLVETGMPEADASRAAKYQAGMLGKFGERIEKQMGQRLAPVVGNVLQQNVQSAFQEVIARDTLGASAIPEVSQAVWDQLLDMANRGQMVGPEVAENLLSIYYIKHLRENGGHPNAPQNQQQQQQPNMFLFPPQQQQQSQQNMNTRFTYPGAGIHARVPMQQQQDNSPAMSADEQAAMAATTASWPIQPKGYQQSGPQRQVFVTRNGRR